MKTTKLWFANAAIAILLILSSCTGERSATRYFDKHPDKAAKFVSQRIIVTTDTITTGLDSASYMEAYNEVWAYADSLLDAASKKCPDINKDSVRTVIKEQLKVKLLPCKDSMKTIVKAYENLERVRYLDGTIELKNNQIIKLTESNNKLQDKISKQVKRIRWLWLFLILAISWIFRKPILSLIKTFL